MAPDETKEPKGVVEQLREAIANSGQSLNRLGKASGVGSDRLSRFMRGERGLNIDGVEKLCRVLRLGLAPLPDEEEPASADNASA